MSSPYLLFLSNRWKECTLRGHFFQRLERFLALALLVSHPLGAQTRVLGPRDYPLQSCASSPTTGYVRQCADTITGNLLCVNALGGSCTPNPTIAAGSMSLPTAAVGANSCSATATTATATGALATDAVAWSFSGDVTGVTGYGGGVALKPKVWTTANTVNVKLCNETAASITPGAASINWSIPGRSSAPVGPSIQHHSIGGCGTGTTCTLTGQVIGTTGNAGYVLLGFCWNSGCSGTVTPACTLAVADGTNTYTMVTGSSSIVSTAQASAVGVFVASNATAGTYTITATITGTGCTFNFGAIWFVDVGGVSASPLDTVQNVTQGNTGPAMSLTSAGTVMYPNELVLAGGMCWSNQAVSSAGTYLLLDRTSSTYYANFYLSGPPMGSTTTFTANCAAISLWSATLTAFHN